METPMSRADCEIVSSRILPFKQAWVYAAFEDPEQLKIWWGPEGFTNTISLFELKPGGTWKLTMHGPDKGNYPNESEFLEVNKPSFISWKRRTQPYFQMEIRIEAISETDAEIQFRMIFENARECNKVKPFAEDKNEENFDRLERLLAQLYPLPE